jgi:acyl-CoA synthetase (AMP-forming)/AMP-acid ligase II
MLRSLPTLMRWRAHPVGALIAAARRYPERAALFDDEGSLTFAEFDQRSTAAARAWQQQGVGPGTTVGVLCQDGRRYFDASIAAQKLGANLVYVNTAFSAPQVAGVVQDEAIDLLVCDEALRGAAADVENCRIYSESELREAVRGDHRMLEPPAASGRIVVLTSGTTGRPKGAVRSGQQSPVAALALLASLPMMSGDTTVVAAPLFHGFGLFNATLALTLSSPIVLRHQFDAETVLADIAARRAAVLVAVPVMLQRMLALPDRVIDRYDLSSLRVVLCGGAALHSELALRFMDRFGDVLHNVYGSTESGFASVATPKDLRRAPGTAGRAAPGVAVRIVADAGHPIPPGMTGRVLVGSGLRMHGYSGGGGKEIIDGLVVTGDLGHLDGQGRLFIDGRDDDMIVSGGENVFPDEVEGVLLGHPAVAEAAVIGVDDAEFGQRLKAFVVRRPGHSVTEHELKAFVHDRLARFKTPREIVFLDVLPRIATGKVLKRELRAL